jgi:hypothetical protein
VAVNLYDQMLADTGETPPPQAPGAPVSDPATWDRRADGSAKGLGFLGLLARPDGRVSSEISYGTTDVDGTERQIPLLVPTLTKDEVRFLLAHDLNDVAGIPANIRNKAIAFAKERQAQGLGVFAGQGEQRMDLYPDLTRAQLADRQAPAPSKYALPDPEPQTPAAAATSKYGDPQADARLASVPAATDPNAATAARAYALATKAGLPVDFVVRNLAMVESATARADFNSDEFRAKNPQLAAWIASDRYHAALAKDDVVPLSLMEHGTAILKNLPAAALAGFYGLSSQIYGAIEGAAETLQQPGVAAGMGLPDLPDTRAALQSAARLATTHAAIAHGAELATAPKASGNLEAGIYGAVEGAPQLLAALGAGAVGGPAAMAGFIGATAGGGAYADVRRQGGSQQRATTYGLLTGAIQTAAASIPAHVLLGNIAARTPIIQTVVHQLLPAVASADVATVLQNAAAWATLPENHDKPFSAYLGEQPSAIASTTIATLLMVGGEGAVTGTGRLVEHLTGGTPATEGALSILGAAAAKSSTLKTAPGKVGEFIDQATRGTQAETVHLPVDSFSQYWQSKNADPASVAAQLTGDPDALAKAQATGEDLAVPTARYVTAIAGTEHNAFFAREARLAPGAPNTVDHEALNARVQDAIASAAASGPEGERPGAVADAVRQQYVDAGIAPDVATRLGGLHQAFFDTLATATDQSPEAAYAAYHFEAHGPDFSGEVRPPASDELQLGQPRLEVLDPETSRVNGSGDSEASLEEQQRMAELKNRGLTRVVYDRTGARRELVGAGYVDYQPAKGETFGIEGPRGFHVLEDNGGKVPASVTRTLYEPAERGGRGFIRIGQGKVSVHLLPGFDLSTLIHETAHFFTHAYEDRATAIAAKDEATRTEAERRLLGNHEALRTAVGAAGERLTEAEHESIAKQFELYIREGRAPSAALRPAFARFRAWLVSVYKSAKSLGVELQPEVRAVFDRMLATDRAIAAADAETGGMVPLLTDEMATAAGLSDDARRAYRASLANALETARERVQADLLKDLRRERESWWQTETSRLADELRPELANTPVYRAQLNLAEGVDTDGHPLPEGTAFKIDRDAAARELGEKVSATLPDRMTGKPGLEPHVVAELLGFPSGTALVRAMADAPPLDQAVAAAADVAMRQRYGDRLVDGSLAEQATRAVLSARAEVLEHEIAMLDELVTKQRGTRPTERPIPLVTIRAIAERRIAETKISDLRPSTFDAAAHRASDRAIAAAGKQDFAGALVAKQQQLLNGELYRAASDARDRVDQAKLDFRVIWGADKKLAPRYNLDLVHAARALLVKFELGRPSTGTREDPFTYLHQVKEYAPQLFNDLQAAIDAAAQPNKPYRDLTVDEFQGVRDAIDNLVHLARRSKQIQIAGRKEELADVVTRLGQRLDVITPEKARPEGLAHKPTATDATKASLLTVRAALRRAEFWTHAVDGGAHDGLFQAAITTPIAEAAARYRLRRNDVIGGAVEIFRTHEPDLAPREIPAAEIGYQWSGKAELLAALTHTGNPSNFRKLLLGGTAERPAWGSVAPDGSLNTARWDRMIRRFQADGTLTKADYDTVQAIWNLTESVKPDAQRVHHDLYGYFFSEVTRQAFDTPFGRYEGGYVPAMYDPLLAGDVSRRADKAALEQTPNSFMFPSTGRGFTKARNEQYARPLWLDLRALPLHLDKVARFIELQPAVNDVGRLVIDRTFDAQLRAFDSGIKEGMLLPYLQRAALQIVETPAQGADGRAVARFFRVLRQRSGLNTLALNVVNSLQQTTGIFPVFTKASARGLAEGLWTYVRGPHAMARDIATKSAFMRTRTSSQIVELQRELSDLVLNPSTFEQGRRFLQAHAHVLAAASQNIVDHVTWRARYSDAIRKGDDEATAVRVADQTVRLTQGSANPEDIAKAEAGTAFTRTFTMFSGYWNAMGNLLGTEATIARQLGLRAGAGKALGAFTFVLFVPAVLNQLIHDASTGDLFKTEDDNYLAHEATNLFLLGPVQQLASFVPGGAAAERLLESWASKHWADDHLNTSPAITSIEAAGRAGPEVYETIAHGKPLDRREVYDVLTWITLITGIPAGAAARPLGYAADVASGKARPTSTADEIRGAVAGR